MTASPAAGMPFAAPRRALVRAVSARFDACLREAKDAKIDVGEARAQHAAYVAALKSLEVEIEAIEPNDEQPDGCFVEDTAVVTGAHALLTVPGATPRQRETLEVLPALKRHCQVHVMSGDARLDGGDVLRVGDVLFVGLSSRTNREGAEALASVARMDGLETRTIELPTGLHLKRALRDAVGVAAILGGQEDQSRSRQQASREMRRSQLNLRSAILSLQCWCNSGKFGRPRSCPRLVRIGDSLAPRTLSDLGRG